MTDSTVQPPARIVGLLRQSGSVVLTLAITLLGLLLVTFFISRVVPIDPVLTVVGERATTAQYDAARAAMGLDDPLWQQFAIYVWNVVHGDLGASLRTRLPVLGEIARYLPATLELSTVAIVIGVWSACPRAFWRRRSPAHGPTRSCGSWG